MTRDPSPDADATRVAEDRRSVPGRRRTGLVLGWTAPILAGAAGLIWLFGPELDEPGTTLLIVALSAIVTAVLAIGCLRRVWSLAEPAGDRTAARCRRWCDGAVAAWGAALILRTVFAQLLGLDGMWLDVLVTVLGAGAVMGYLGMLVLTARWRPALSADGDQL